MIKYLLLSLISVAAFIDPCYGQYITTVAGGGTSDPGDSGLATGAQLYYPEGIAFSPSGDLYIADEYHHRIRRIDAATGIIYTVAGTGTSGFSGDSGLATLAKINGPSCIAFDHAGDMYIGDFYNNRIRRVSAATGIITTIAGGDSTRYNGDNIPADHAWLSGPNGLVTDSAGNLYFGDSGHQRVRRIDATSGIITTVAGGGTNNPGDSGLATAAELFEPQGIAIGPGGTLYIADGISGRVHMVDPVSLIITTIAGNGIINYSGDGGPAIDAELDDPWGLLLTDTTLYIADAHNNRVRAVDLASGIITTFAGDGDAGFSGDTVLGDGGFCYEATLWNPTGLALDSAGNIYVADYADNRVRLISDYYTGITQIAAADSMSLYPNPSNGSFILLSSGCAGRQYEISDMIGSVIARQTITADRQPVYLPQAAPGTYVLSIAGTDRPIKFVVD